MFRLSICLLLGSATASGDDETSSLMQGFKPMNHIKRRQDEQHDKHSLANLLESAKGMLKNGETPEVVSFVQVTLDDIVSTVLPAIRDASAVDQQQLDAHFHLFELALQALEEGNREIYLLNNAETEMSTEHKHCRDEEKLKCDTKLECDYDLYGLWTTFVTEETELRVIERRIDGHFCATNPLIPLGETGHWTANGTTHSFRETSPPMMIAYSQQFQVVVISEENYDEMVPTCEHHYAGLDAQTADCDAHQTRLEDSACQHAAAINRVRSSFNCAWQNAVITYTETEARVRLMQIDRIREWRHLSTVQCLLARTTERNGRPCEESTDEAVVEIAHCEEEYQTEEVRSEIASWIVSFPCEARMCADGSTGIGPHLNADGSTNDGCSGPLVCPAYPADCVDRHNVVGRCYPQHVQQPCTAGFLAQEYSALPAVPQAVFHNSNSHCNQRPDCQTCILPEEEECNLELPPVTAPPVTVTVAPVTAPPQPTTTTTTTTAAPTCGPRPELTNAAWNPSVEGHLQYQCEEGYSFSGSFLEETREIECLADGQHSTVRVCLPIDDCVGHSCGAFGACVDLHMDYTCNCLDGYELNTVEGEQMCGNVDDCQGHSCGMGGVCEDLIQDYSCNCNDGWEEIVESDNTRSCERIECGDVPRVDNVMRSGDEGGIFPWNRGKAVYQDIVEYDCLSGYSTNGQLDGQRTFSITCQANGEFTEVHQCLPVTCGEPEASGSATPVSADALHFGQSVEYQCPAGHGPSSFDRICQTNGQLSPAIACEPRSCGAMPLFVMASAASSSPMYFFGQRAEYSCSEGYSTNAMDPVAREFSVECLATGWQTGVVGCIPVACEFQPDETHAADAALNLEFGGSAIITCSDGHTIDGSAGGATEHFATCNANGVHDVPSCRPVTCPSSNLPTALHAQVESRDYTLGTHATYSCNDGYAVAATAAATFEIECLRHGSFSAMSTCRNIDDCAGHSCGSNGRCVDGLGDYSCECEDGFEETVSDSGERMCGNVNDCGASLCGSNGACHDLTNGYECVCDTGYAVPESDSSNADRLCLPVVCSIPAVENVVRDADVLHFPQTLYLECAEGHSISHQSSTETSFEIECGADSVLTSGGSADLPECSPIMCRPAPSVLHAHESSVPSSQTGNYVFGEVAQYDCQGGEVEVTYECHADGQFRLTSQFTTCQNSCGAPSVPSHAHRLDGAGAVIHPAAATWACEPGFTHLASGEASGAASQACQANGVYASFESDVAVDSEGRATCVPMVCQRPDAPANWAWMGSCDDYACDLFDSQNPAHLRCANGYQTTTGLSAAASQTEITCHQEGSTAGGQHGHSALPLACEMNTFTFSGRVRSALPPRGPVANAVLSIAGQTISTCDVGCFTMSLPAGEHEVSLSHDGFITYSGTVTISADTIGYELHMSPVLSGDEWRIVLTWGVSPRDLDSHLMFYGTRCPEMFYGLAQATCGGVSASLNVDDTSSLGPEVTTLSNLNRCHGRNCNKWVYKVRNYSGRYDTNNGWAESQAVVTLYNGDHVAGTYRVGEHGHTTDNGRGIGSSKDWTLLSIDSHGQVALCTNSNCD